MSRDDAMTPRTDADRIDCLERQVALLSAEQTRVFGILDALTREVDLPEGWKRVLHGASGESLRAKAAIEEVLRGR